MRMLRTKAIVLRRTNYGEADRVVQLLTPIGRRSVMARGVRKEKSKLAGGIELFAVSDVVIGDGKGELGILTSVKLDHFYHHILEDYDRLQFGYTAIRLVSKASEQIDEPEWFDLLVETMQGLDTLSIHQTLIECWFYSRYSSLLGHELNLEIDSQGKPFNEDDHYRYDNTEQGFYASETGEINSEHIKLFRLIATKPLRVLNQIGGISEFLPTCLQILRDHAAVDIA